MKKIFILSSLILMLTAFSGGAAAQKKKLTVNDYYLDIPAEYLKVDRVKRAKWVDEKDAKSGYLKFNLPSEISGDEGWGGAEVWGEIQLFPKTGGRMIVAMIVNRCLESVCMGQILLLETGGAGKWENVSDALVPQIDPDEIKATLKDSPAYERPVIEDEDIPLSLSFQRVDKLIQYHAACVSLGCDGSVIAKSFKWNGAKFEAFEYAESP